MMEEFTLRPLNEEDWMDLKNIRLEALSLHPAYFSPSKDETQFTEVEWKARILNPMGRIFGLYFNGKIVGLSGIVIDKNYADTAHFVMSYIRDEFRRQNLSALFYSARTDWAKKRPHIKTLVLDVNEDNIPSQKSSKSNGFVFHDSYFENGKKILTFKMAISG